MGIFKTKLCEQCEINKKIANRYVSPTDKRLDRMAAEYRDAIRQRETKAYYIKHDRIDRLGRDLFAGTITPDEYTEKMAKVTEGIDEIVAALYPLPKE